MDEEFSHGGDDGAFVGFAAFAQALNIGRDDGVAVRCGLIGHVEAPTDFGATADDGALAGELAAVAVEGGKAGQGDEAVAVEMFDFREIGQKGQSGDAPLLYLRESPVFYTAGAAFALICAGFGALQEELLGRRRIRA